MRRSLGLFVLYGAFFSCGALLSGCGGDESLAGPPRDSGVHADAFTSRRPDGLPCDVANVLAAQCTSCHASPPFGGAPMSLLSYADLSAPSRSMPSLTNVQLSIMRMSAATLRMPPAPSPAPSAADIAVLQAWVDGGMQRGSCSMPTSPYDTPVTCTSGTHWTQGDDSSREMHPGGTCVSCHATAPNPPDPQPTIAGTVYATAHEPTDCDGASGTTASPITIDVFDAAGHTFTMTANRAGNFMDYQAVTFPITAAVHHDGRTRVMATAQPSADCNTCHTESGTMGAPGRVMAP